MLVKLIETKHNVCFMKIISVEECNSPCQLLLHAVSNFLQVGQAELLEHIRAEKFGMRLKDLNHLSSGFHLGREVVDVDLRQDLGPRQKTFFAETNETIK